MAGSGNGIAIARTLLAKVWLSAHDEDKDDQGFSVKRLRVDAKTAVDVRKMLYQDLRNNGGLIMLLWAQEIQGWKLLYHQLELSGNLGHLSLDLGRICTTTHG